MKTSCVNANLYLMAFAVRVRGANPAAGANVLSHVTLSPHHVAVANTPHLHGRGIGRAVERGLSLARTRVFGQHYTGSKNISL